MILWNMWILSSALNQTGSPQNYLKHSIPQNCMASSFRGYVCNVYTVNIQYAHLFCSEYHQYYLLCLERLLFQCSKNLNYMIEIINMYCYWVISVIPTWGCFDCILLQEGGFGNNHCKKTQNKTLLFILQGLLNIKILDF